MGLIGIRLSGRKCRGTSPAGTIKQLRGTAVVQRNGRSIAATPAMPILAGDKLETSPQSTVTIGYIDGGELILSETSSLIDRSYVDKRGRFDD
jgi:hypothetical protein